jgi:outer membrane lipopolysaccharide assembly protein LptE/RlpB
MRKFLLCLVLSLSVCACGYRFVGGGSFPGGIRQVFVPVFENRTAEIGFENTFTNDLIYEITRGGQISIGGQDSSQGVLSGTIVLIGTDTVSRRAVNEAAERRVTMMVDLKLARSGGELVWAANSVAGNETYRVTDDRLQTESNKEAALERLSRRMAEIIYNRMTSDF